MAAIQGRKGELWTAAADAAVAITKEACEAVGDSTTIFHVTAAAKRYLDPATTILVYDTDSLVTSGYHIAGGCQVHFDEAPSGAVTLTGAYLTMAEVGLVQGWELGTEMELYETTSLGDTVRTYVSSGILSWSCSFERFYEDNTWQAKAKANATTLMVRLFEDHPSGFVWTGWVIPTGWTQTVPLALETESLSFTGVGVPVYSVDET